MAICCQVPVAAILLVSLLVAWLPLAPLVGATLEGMEAVGAAARSEVVEEEYLENDT